MQTIKIIAADPAFTETQLSNWRTAAALSHPHLIRLLDSGRSQLKGHPFLFVVMEYAEQSLSQILPHRALTVDETREMLLPTLDALVFLHHQNLVHGAIKPSNLLVVNDQLKISSDTIRPAGELTTRVAKSSLYDPPEAKSGRIGAAGDIWALGVTLVEALTQRPPAWSEGFDTPTLPESLPPAFAETVRRCLSRNPADRPTAVDLEAEMKGAPAPVPIPAVPVPPVSIPQSAVETAPSPTAPRDEPIKQRMLVPIATALLLILVVGWTFFRLLQRHSDVPASRLERRSNIDSANCRPCTRLAKFAPVSRLVSRRLGPFADREGRRDTQTPTLGRRLSPVGSTGPSSGGRFAVRAPQGNSRSSAQCKGHDPRPF